MKQEFEMTDNDPGTEAEHLSSIGDGHTPSGMEFVKDIQFELQVDAIHYATNKNKKVGEVCTCAGPKCKQSFKKKSYQQAFHSTKCKDQFWNRVRFWNNTDKVEALVEKLDTLKYGEDESIFEGMY